MTTTVKAIYEDGVLKPRSPLELEEHTEVRVLVMKPLAHDPDDPTGWKAIDELIGCLKSGRGDVAENHDSYLYGNRRD
jgi:predicted DNA-binding antitoxin AbrB/MazE fold protein